MKGIVYQEITRILPKLKRFAFGLSGSMPMAEDLVQEACARLLSDPKDKTDYIEQWLFRTIRNLHIDQMRSHAVAERYQGKIQVHDDGQFDGDEQLEVLETLDVVREAIFRLPDDQRTTMLLIGVEGFSYKEAAEILGVPMGTITSRLARARKKLLETVSAYPAEDQPAGDSNDGYGD